MLKTGKVAGFFVIIAFVCVVVVFIIEEVRFEPKEARFESYVVCEDAVNINTADIEELVLLDGVGEGTAKRIIEAREQNGGFGDVNELKMIRGIGEKTFDKIKNRIKVSE